MEWGRRGVMYDPGLRPNTLVTLNPPVSQPHNALCAPGNLPFVCHHQNCLALLMEV